MSDVAAQLKIMPTSPEVDLSVLESELEDTLPEGADVRAFEHEDVAFGLVALLTTVVVPDDEGGTEAVEEAVSSHPDVESVEVQSVGRL